MWKTTVRSWKIVAMWNSKETEISITRFRFTSVIAQVGIIYYNSEK